MLLIFEILTIGWGFHNSTLTEKESRIEKKETILIPMAGKDNHAGDVPPFQHQTSLTWSSLNYIQSCVRSCMALGCSRVLGELVWLGHFTGEVSPAPPHAAFIINISFRPTVKQISFWRGFLIVVLLEQIVCNKDCSPWFCSACFLFSRWRFLHHKYVHIYINKKWSQIFLLY